MITFPTANACVTISIENDEIDEPLEYFGVIADVSVGHLGTIPDNHAIVLIRDEDCKSNQSRINGLNQQLHDRRSKLFAVLVVRFSNFTYMVDEGGTSILVCLDLVFGVVGDRVPLSVRVQSLDADTSNGCDGNAMCKFFFKCS